ncbi:MULTISPECIES: hypothetical protein [unclassified Mesorhizobium]|uniref:hypothetical protein n=1 Tax=unclassified Mesorhizobium TaxID=325217 RepID=UPI0010934D5C|nr:MULTISPECIES: hypothetical protein [unclassified Mesorhizobium]TGT89559.1 hypothetical protein EN804_11740 [Mesorhizobium sp. M8A.F.Ca.ET.161.01.1.1]TGV42117.1 hypothetical protein EN785_11730 [Mesorhizobium sp. M8A.F.Ca.ET.142.01.1.1]
MSIFAVRQRPKHAESLSAGLAKKVAFATERFDQQKCRAKAVAGSLLSHGEEVPANQGLDEVIETLTHKMGDYRLARFVESHQSEAPGRIGQRCDALKVPIPIDTKLEEDHAPSALGDEVNLVGERAWHVADGADHHLKHDLIQACRNHLASLQDSSATTTVKNTYAQLNNALICRKKSTCAVLRRQHRRR